MTYEGPDRRATTSPNLTNELRAVSEAVTTLAAQMEQSIPEKQLQELVQAVAVEEQRGRWKFIVAIASPLLIVLVLGIATLIQSTENHEQGQQTQRIAQDAAVVADYVRDCLQTPAAQRDQSKCGADGSAKIIQGLIESINCSLLISPSERTEAKLNDCAAKAFGG